MSSSWGAPADPTLGGVLVSRSLAHRVLCSRWRPPPPGRVRTPHWTSPALGGAKRVVFGAEERHPQ